MNEDEMGEGLGLDPDPAEQSASEFVSPMEAARRVFLASIGAVAAATEVTDQIFQEMVKKGEQTKEEAAREFREARERSATRRAEASGFMRTRVDSVLNAASLPSKSDVDAINAKLNILTRKIDEVQASQVDKATSPAAPGSSATRSTESS